MKTAKQYILDYINKICGKCGRKSNDGLYLDLNVPIKERIGKCKRCYFKNE